MRRRYDVACRVGQFDMRLFSKFQCQLYLVLNLQYFLGVKHFLRDSHFFQVLCSSKSDLKKFLSVFHSEKALIFLCFHIPTKYNLNNSRHYFHQHIECHYQSHRELQSLQPICWIRCWNCNNFWQGLPLALLNWYYTELDLPLDLLGFSPMHGILFLFQFNIVILIQKFFPQQCQGHSFDQSRKVFVYGLPDLY